MFVTFLQAAAPYIYVWTGGVVLYLLAYSVCSVIGIEVLDLDESGEKSTLRPVESICLDALLWPISILVATYWAIVRHTMK